MTDVFGVKPQGAISELSTGQCESQPKESTALYPEIHPYDCFGKLPKHPRGWYTSGDIVELDGQKYILSTKIAPLTKEIF